MNPDDKQRVANGDELAEDQQRAAYWCTVGAAMPPMTAEQIATVAVLLDRVDARRFEAK